MNARKTVAGAVVLSAIAWLLVTAVTVFSQNPRFEAPLVKIPERNPVGLKPTVPFSARFTVTDFDAVSKPEILNRSMTTRRQVAWQVVRRVWERVPIGVDSRGANRYVPMWMTWYEQEDIARLYDDMLRRKRAASTVDAVGDVDAALRRHAVKDLAVSLHSSRLGKTLRQFTFPENRDLGPHRTPGTGSIYYSPSYVRHLLENADRIANCDPEAFPTPAGRARRSDPLSSVAPLGIEAVPARLRPSNQKNVYALCMDQEMPRDAVMIKTAWYPVRRARALDTTSPGGKDDVWMPGQRLFQLASAMAEPLLRPPAGRWVEKTLRSPPGRLPAGESWSGQFLLTDENGQEWALLGMHIATKILPTWMWISWFAMDPRDWAWSGEKEPMPEWFSAILQGSFYMYGVCVASDFREGDPRPWAAYLGGPPLERSPPQQAETFRAIAGVMKGYQWCSNPYIETNMARGNCVGCHQGSPVSFLPTTLGQLQAFNISDFSFSFTTNRASIIDVRRRHGVR